MRMIIFIPLSDVERLYTRPLPISQALPNSIMTGPIEPASGTDVRTSV